MTNTPSNPGAIAQTSLSGSEIVSLNNGPVWTSATTSQIAGLASQVGTSKKATALNTVGAGTIPAAGIIGQFIIRGGAQSGTAFTDTTDTAANIIAALPAGAPVGSAFSFDYANTTNAVATIAHGTGVTISSGITPTATVTIPANGYTTFLVTVATSSTITMVETGSGAYVADSADTTKVLGYNLTGQTTGTAAWLATSNTANATYTLPPSTGSLSATSGSNLNVTDVYRTSAAVTANANVTPATVTGLSGAIAVGTYKFRAYLPSTVASGTGGIAYSFALTTAILSAMECTGTGYTASAVAVQHTTTATSGTTVFTQAAVVLQTMLEGTFTVSTAGTIAIQMCQNTSNASNTVALVGGYLELVRIA